MDPLARIIPHGLFRQNISESKMTTRAVWGFLPEGALEDAEDFEEAMAIWAQHVGRPMNWNEWQVGSAEIRVRFPASAPPPGPALQAALSAHWNSVMLESAQPYHIFNQCKKDESYEAMVADGLDPNDPL